MYPRHPHLCLVITYNIVLSSAYFLHMYYTHVCTCMHVHTMCVYVYSEPYSILSPTSKCSWHSLQNTHTQTQSLVGHSLRHSRLSWSTMCRTASSFLPPFSCFTAVCALAEVQLDCSPNTPRLPTPPFSMPQPVSQLPSPLDRWYVYGALSN